MAHDTSWYIPQRAILQRVWGELTIEEMAEINKELESYLDQGIPLVHILIDVTKVEKYPNSVHQIGKVMKRNNTEREGWTLLVTNSQIIRFIGSVVTQFSTLRFRTFQKFEDAVEFLLHQDSTLTAKNGTSS
jgi:hypothetical protein